LSGGSKAKIVGLSGLNFVTPNTNESSGDKISKLIPEFKVPTNVKSGALRHNNAGLPRYRDQQRRASGRAANRFSNYAE
jgi:hypothetical protein